MGGVGGDGGEGKAYGAGVKSVESNMLDRLLNATGKLRAAVMLATLSPTSRLSLLMFP